RSRVGDQGHGLLARPRYAFPDDGRLQERQPAVRNPERPRRLPGAAARERGPARTDARRRRAGLRPLRAGSLFLRAVRDVGPAAGGRGPEHRDRDAVRPRDTRAPSRDQGDQGRRRRRGVPHRHAHPGRRDPLPRRLLRPARPGRGTMTRRRAGFRWDWGAEAAHLVAFLALVFVLCWYAGIGLAETVSTYVEEGRFTLAGLVVALNLGMGALLYAALRFAAGTVRLGFLLLVVLGLLVDRVVIETTDTLPSAETISLAYHDRAQASAFFEHFVGGGMILRLLAMALLAIGLLRIAALRRRRVSGVATLGAIVGFVLSVAAGIFLELRTGGAFDSYMEPYRL